jgi:HlyD family secretion protein
MRMIAAGIAVVVMLVLSAGAALSMRAVHRPSGKAAAAVDSVPPTVSVQPATVGDVVTRVLATGSVTSIRDAKLGSKVSGRVAAVLVDEGMQVAAGAPLLRLDTNDLLAQEAQAQANVAAAQAQLTKTLVGARPQERQQSTDAVAQARATLTSAQASASLAQTTVDRDRTLAAQGAIAQQDLDQANTQLRVAQAQVAQAQAAYDSAVQNAALVKIGSRDEDIQAARAQLAQAEAGLAAIDAQLHDSTVYAPFAGTITQRSVEPGEIVSSVSASSTNPLLVLSQVDDVYVEFVVPAQHRFQLRVGETGVMSIDGLPGQTFTGRVEEVRPAADASSRTFGVRVLVPNPTRILRPGMFARGAIVVGTRRNVLQIPEQAVVTATSGPMVFVVAHGTAFRRPVTLGAHHDGTVEVTAGLRPGEQVVVDGQNALTDNQPVAVRAR